MPHNMHVRNILGFFLNINLHKNLIVFFWRVAHSLKNKFKFQRIHLRERPDLCCQPKMVQSLREMTFKKVLFFVSMDFNYRPIDLFYVNIWLIIMWQKFNLPNIFWKIEFQWTHAGQTSSEVLSALSQYYTFCWV